MRNEKIPFFHRWLSLILRSVRGLTDIWTALGGYTFDAPRRPEGQCGRGWPVGAYDVECGVRAVTLTRCLCVAASFSGSLACPMTLFPVGPILSCYGT